MGVADNMASLVKSPKEAYHSLAEKGRHSSARFLADCGAFPPIGVMSCWRKWCLASESVISSGRRVGVLALRIFAVI